MLSCVAWAWSLLATFGCTSTPHAVKVVDERYNHGIVVVHKGSRVELLLHSSYWQVHESSRPDVLRQEGQPVLLQGPRGGCLPGIGCRPEQAMFTAESPGEAVLSASRASCGEALRCLPDNSQFKVVVDVLP